ncbi:MBOAT, membrane-bound O-acyltransferase family-domain-containing protein [Haematococcus lacustris]
MAGLWASLVEASDAAQRAMSGKHNVFAVQPWETQAGTALGMSKDQLRFAIALFLSVPTGLGMRLFKSPTARHLYSLSTGLLLVYWPFGQGVCQALLPAILTYLAMAALPRQCGAIAWAVNMPYLIYLHVINASGHSWAQGDMDFTGCLMVLVLKLISLAMSYQDHHTKKKEAMTEFQAAHAVAKLPSPLSYASYMFSLGNLLAGPYLEFADYLQFVERQGVWSDSLPQAPPLGRAVLVYGESMLFMASYLALLPSFNLNTFSTPAYLSSPIYLKGWVQLMAGIVNQLKYAFAWKLSEAGLVLAGADFEGWKDGKAVWGRACNVHFFQLLASDSARLIPGFWNIRTGQFLRRYVYERLTPAGRKPGFVQLLATQMVSAIWHGLYPGYMLFFAGSALWIHFSTVVWKLEQRYLPRALATSLPWVALKLLWTHYTLNYMASAFMVLEARGSLAVYQGVYYWPHVVMLVGNLVVGPLLLGGGKAKGKDKGKGQGSVTKTE